MEMNMKSTMGLLGILATSMVLFACDGGSGKPVKTEKVYRLDGIVKDQPSGGKRHIINDYDNNGLLLKQHIRINDSGRDYIYIDYKYDDEGKLLTSKEYKHGYLRGEIFYHANPMVMGYLPDTLKYDVYNRPSKIVKYDKSGNITSVENFFYDNNKRVGSELDRGNDGVIDVRTVYSYDGSTIKETIDYKPLGNLDGENVFIYNESEDIIQRYFVLYPPKDPVAKIGVVDYDNMHENGRIKEVSYNYGDETLVDKYTWGVHYIPVK